MKAVLSATCNKAENAYLPIPKRSKTFVNSADYYIKDHRASFDDENGFSVSYGTGDETEVCTFKYALPIGMRNE